MARLKDILSKELKYDKNVAAALGVDYDSSRQAKTRSKLSTKN